MTGDVYSFITRYAHPVADRTHSYVQAIYLVCPQDFYFQIEKEKIDDRDSTVILFQIFQLKI